MLIKEVPGTIVMRILADDVPLMGMGLDHFNPFVKAYGQLFEYIQDMGSHISAKKSYLFSTGEHVRQFMEDYIWPHVLEKIQMVSDIRDLGAHLNLTAHHIGTTLTQRLQAALAKTNRLGWFPSGIHAKAKLVLNGLYSGALYGSEAVHASEFVLSSLSSAAATFLHGVNRDD